MGTVNSNILDYGTNLKKFAIESLILYEVSQNDDFKINKSVVGTRMCRRLEKLVRP